MPTRRVVASRSSSDRRDAASDNAGSSQLAFEVVDATMICSAAVPAKNRDQRYSTHVDRTESCSPTHLARHCARNIFLAACTLCTKYPAQQS